MKSEFKERCCQIRLNDLSDVEMWHQAMRKISDSILYSFANYFLVADTTAQAIEDQEQNGTSPDLVANIVNFKKLFLAKENMALGFLVMNMLDE